MDRKIYGSINGEAKLVNDLYGRGDIITSLTGTIDPENPYPFITAFDNAVFYSYLKNNHKSLLYTSSTTARVNISSISAHYYVTLSINGETTPLIGGNAVSPTATASDLANIGITVTTPPVTATQGAINLSLTVNGQAQKITKLYGSAEQDITAFTNTGNVTVDKSLFLGKVSDAGWTDLNGRVEILKNGNLVQIIRVYPDNYSAQSIIGIHSGSLISSSAASELLATWGIGVSATYIAGLPSSAYNIITKFTTTRALGTKLIHQGFGHVKYIIPEHFSITPDGTIITAIDGETLCALAKSQYPNKYTQTVSATFRYDGSYYISGRNSNSESTFYRSGGVSAMTNAGVTFATGLSGNVSVTLPVTYVPETT